LRVLGISRSTGKTIAELKQGMKKYPQVLMNVSITDPLSIMNHSMVQSALTKTEEMLKGKGRVLLRPSGTEPVIRVMVEGQDKRQIQGLAEKLAAIVQTVEKIK
ncbi:MAG TPA: phosphoglucosamine mutase, partial [Gammaproteobacteria bacterium]|nr:phosphoglucosamine mutase [Gammaproteobacteria bacterium]